MMGAGVYVRVALMVASFFFMMWSMGSGSTAGAVFFGLAFLGWMLSLMQAMERSANAGARHVKTDE